MDNTIRHFSGYQLARKDVQNLTFKQGFNEKANQHTRQTLSNPIKVCHIRLRVLACS